MSFFKEIFGKTISAISSKVEKASDAVTDFAVENPKTTTAILLALAASAAAASSCSNTQRDADNNGRSPFPCDGVGTGFLGMPGDISHLVDDNHTVDSITQDNYDLYV